MYFGSEIMIKTTKNPLVSIVIATKNEAINLPRLVKSILSQTYVSYEIIVVDNHSADNTLSVAHSYTPYVYTQGNERSSQRNFGARRSRGSYLLFPDGDMELDRNLIQECVSLSLTHSSIGAIILSEAVAGDSFIAQCRALEKQCYLGDDLIEAARFFPRDVFLNLGGYDTSLVASEDWDLTARVRNEGFEVFRTKNMIYHFEKEHNLFSIFRKKYYYGMHLPRYFSKHPFLSRRQYTIFRPAFFRNWRILLKSPYFFAGLIVIKFFEFTGGGLGYLVALWKRRKS